MSCNLFTHLAWLIPDTYPEVGEDGLSIPNNINTFSTMPTMSAERLEANSHTKSHQNSIAHSKRKQEPGDCSILN